MGHGANRVYLPLPKDKVCVCPVYAWEWIEFFGIDPCKEFTEHEAEAITIMDREALMTCPRRREAMEGIRKNMWTRPSPKRDVVTKKILAMLREKFPENQHHEDYRKLIKRND